MITNIIKNTGIYVKSKKKNKKMAVDNTCITLK